MEQNALFLIVLAVMNGGGFLGVLALTWHRSKQNERELAETKQDVDQLELDLRRMEIEVAGYKAATEQQGIANAELTTEVKQVHTELRRLAEAFHRLEGILDERQRQGKDA